MRETNFNVFVPVELHKAGSASDEWRIGGVAATESTDLDGEQVIMKGLDTSYLEKGRAHFNWNHENGPDSIVGEIDIFRKSSKELYVEGVLYKGVKKAKDIWSLMKSMAADSNRKLGFSIEGKIRQREDNKIVKSWVKAVAITHEPVNPYTMADLVKSLTGAGGTVVSGEPEMGGEVLFHNRTGEPVWQLIPAGSCVLNKALDVSHTLPISGSQGGMVVTQEDLENDEEEKRKRKKLRTVTNKSLSFEEAVYTVQKSKNVSLKTAERVVRFAMDKENAK